MTNVSYHLDPERDDKLNRVKDKIKGSSLFKAANGGNPLWLNYKGKFNLDMFYKRMHIWLTENGYSDVDGYSDRFERYFFEKRNPDGSIGEIWFWWRAKRNEDSLFEFRIDIDVQVLVMKKDEVVVEGNKFGVHNGEISVFFKPNLTFKFDVDPNWTKDPFISPLLGWWKNRGFREQIDEKKGLFYTEFNEFYATIKQFLGLENYMLDRKTEFHPVQGLPQYKL